MEPSSDRPALSCSPTGTAVVIGARAIGSMRTMPLAFPPSGAPANAYVAEDGVTYYVAEDGVTYYVQET